jgi:hypothetical protein
LPMTFCYSLHCCLSIAKRNNAVFCFALPFLVRHDAQVDHEKMVRIVKRIK